MNCRLHNISDCNVKRLLFLFLQPCFGFRFQNKISQSRLWPVEILRTLPSHHKGSNISVTLESTH